MTRSSRTALTLLRQDHSCPPWCERTDHDADVVDDDSPPRHYGPEWGRFAAEAIGNERPCVSFTCGPGEDMAGAEFSALDLRNHSADALAAAEWLEAPQ